MPPLLLLLICMIGLTAHAGPAWARDPDGPSRLLTIVNRAHQSITEVHVSAAINDSWGDDLLLDQHLPAAGRATVKLPPSRECLVDVQVVYADGRAEERRGFNACRIREIAFDASHAEQADADVPTRQIAILNRSARPIAQVFVSPASSDDWGEDRLGDTVIKPANRADVPFTGGCVGDVRVVFDNKAAEERRGLDLCATEMLVVRPGWTTADDYGQLDTIVAPVNTQQVTVVNKSGFTITQLYLMAERPATASGEKPAAEDEGRDRLGRAVLRPGSRTYVPFDRGSACKIAVHAVFQKETPDIRQIADLCQSGEIAIGP